MASSKFFKNGKTFSSFCRLRYGQSKQIWEHTELWERSGKFAIGFDLEAADKLFPPKEEELDASGSLEDIKKEVTE